MLMLLRSSRRLLLLLLLLLYTINRRCTGHCGRYVHLIHRPEIVGGGRIQCGPLDVRIPSILRVNHMSAQSGSVCNWETSEKTKKKLAAYPVDIRIRHRQILETQTWPAEQA